MMAYTAGQTAEAGNPVIEKYAYRGRETGYQTLLNYFKIGVFI
jgi:hypothetical protein